MVHASVFLCGHLTNAATPCSNLLVEKQASQAGVLASCARLCSTEAGHELYGTVVRRDFKIRFQKDVKRSVERACRSPRAAVSHVTLRRPCPCVPEARVPHVTLGAHV